MNGSPEFSLSGGNITIFAWSPFGGGSKRTGNAASLPGFNGERQAESLPVSLSQPTQETTGTASAAAAASGYSSEVV
ncbi:TPA: hypothetical protein JDH29_004392, partial [Salmonella enterica subsp. houtenae]|nr:hypothetical protein [Salmonella enterica subsp. houtenae]